MKTNIGRLIFWAVFTVIVFVLLYFIYLIWSPDPLGIQSLFS